MANLNPSTQFWILGGVQIFGFVSAWLARLSEGSGHQAKCQGLFLLGLVLMGGSDDGRRRGLATHLLARPRLHAGRDDPGRDLRLPQRRPLDHPRLRLLGRRRVGTAAVAPVRATVVVLCRSVGNAHPPGRFATR